jgi:hypothetical protein
MLERKKKRLLSLLDKAGFISYIIIMNRDNRLRVAYLFSIGLRVPNPSLILRGRPEQRHVAGGSVMELTRQA